MGAAQSRGFEKPLSFNRRRSGSGFSGAPIRARIRRADARERRPAGVVIAMAADEGFN